MLTFFLLFSHQMIEVSTAHISNDSTRFSRNISSALYGTHTSATAVTFYSFPDDPAIHQSSTTTLIRGTTSRTLHDFVLTKGPWLNIDITTTPKAVPTATTDSEKQRTFRSKHHYEHHWGPFFEEPFDSMTGDHVVSTAYMFMEAVLNCRVGMLKDKTVMWLRRTTEKVSLLTVGNVTYSGDPRIRVKFQYPNNWRLLINPAQKDDAGLYMCQVSTHPPRVFTTNLTILEPPLRLIDDQGREIFDRYYKYGSAIDLRCQVSKNFVRQQKLREIQFNKSKNRTGSSTNETNQNQTRQAQFLKELADYVVWTKDDGQLPLTVVRKFSTSEKWLISRISIADAKLPDSGNYSCSLGKLFTAIVQVQVLTGELPAAVHHNSKSSVKLMSKSHVVRFGLVMVIFLSPRDILLSPSRYTL